VNVHRYNQAPSKHAHWLELLIAVTIRAIHPADKQSHRLPSSLSWAANVSSSWVVSCSLLTRYNTGCQSCTTRLGITASVASVNSNTDTDTANETLKASIAFHVNQSQSYGASPAIWDHTVLPATRHRWTCPTLTPAKWTVLNLLTSEGWKAELNSMVRYIPRWLICPQRVDTHPSSSQARCKPTLPINTNITTTASHLLDLIAVGSRS